MVRVSVRCSDEAVVEVEHLTRLFLVENAAAVTVGDGTVTHRGHYLCVCVCVLTSVWRSDTDLMRLEKDVSQVEDRGQQPVDGVLFLWSETQNVHGVQQTPEVLPIVLTLYSTVSPLKTHVVISNNILPLEAI